MNMKCNTVESLGCSLRIALLTLSVAMCLGRPSATRADEPTAVPIIANGTTVCIVQLDMARLALPKDESLKPLQRVLDEVRQAVGDQTLTIAVDLPYRSAGSFMRLAAKTQGINQQQLKTLVQSYAASLHLVQPVTQGDWTVVGVQLPAPPETKADAQISTKLLPVDFDRWQLALDDPTNAPMQVAVVPPSYLRRAFEELAPDLPAALGGGPSQVLTEGVQWLQLSFDPSTLTGRLLAQSASAPAAGALVKHFPHMLDGLIDQVGPELEPLKTALKNSDLLKPEQQSSQFVVPLKDNEARQLFALLERAAQEGAARVAANQSSNNLKQLALSIHNYVDAHNSFPPDAEARGKDGHSGLSWRVHILPYIGEADLYKEFKLDEPWDSPHNIKLLRVMPPVFAPVLRLGESSLVEAYHTLYAAPVGEQTIFGGEKPVRFQSITDGTSNTVMIVELAPEHAVAWTSPEDYQYDRENPGARLYSRDGKALAAYADGSARSLRIDNSPEAWNAAFTMNGGEYSQLK